MSHLPAYERDPYQTRLETRVLETGEEAGRPFAVLDDTLLFPEGGGQPADHGLLEGVPVVDVQKRAGRIRHYLDRPLEPAPAGAAALSLDWPRRFDHMQQHTGQHLLSAVALDRFGWATTAFHLGAQVSDIELAAPRISLDELAALEEAVAEEIRQARPVRCRRVAPEELPALQVRSRGLPEGFSGEVRLVEIQGVDLNTCGGTHLRNTAELEGVSLLGTESLRGGTRVFFVFGARARSRMLAHERRNAALRNLLGVPDERLAEALGLRLEQQKDLERRLRQMEEEWAESLAAALALEPVELAERHFEQKDLACLQRVARLLTARAPAKAAFFTATQAGQSCFLLLAGAGSRLDAALLGREVAALLGAKGGGSGAQFQGKCGSLDGRAQAVARLAAALEQAPTGSCPGDA